MRNAMSRSAAALVLATLSLAVAACGAGENSSPKAPFTQRAHSICAGMQAQAGVITGSRKPTDAEFLRLLAQWRDGFTRLATLEPPVAQAKQFREMIAHYRTMTAALAAAQAADDESVLGDFAAAIVEGTRGSRAARGAGLPSCAFFPELRRPPHDPEPALAATQALIPAGASIRRADTAGCNVEASCRFEFIAAGSAAKQLRVVLTTLRAHGWTHVQTGRSPTGTRWATGYRNDYEVEIELIGTPGPGYCRGAPATMFGCTDSVWVHRVEIPQVSAPLKR
jgi:hypothetical protein